MTSRAVVGLLLTASFVLCSLGSFALPPEDAFLMPPVLVESRPLPQLYVIPEPYRPWVDYYADLTGVPRWMAARLFSVESTGDPLSGRWNPNAVSWAGAQGLAQLMPRNLVLFAKYNEGKPVDPFDPETAIKVGLRYLADLYAVTGSWSIALRSYNGGLSHYFQPAKYGPWPEESLLYAARIMGGGKE